MTRDAVERRRAFTGLLANPVLDRARFPELFALVRSARHRPMLVDWFGSRLGYRLVVTDTAARLFRLPLAGAVIAPARLDAPPRRVAVLALLAAATAEDAEDLTTTQDLSDRVRLLTARPDVGLAPYDPDRFAERQLFLRGLELLVGTGALRPVGRDAEEKGESRRNAVGTAYTVERALLLRMVDPAALEAALDDGASHGGGAVPEHANRFGLMRRLVELPVCLLDDLTDGERAYLASQRHRILAWCTEMTGWTVEQRAEGLALVAAEESDTDVPFPRLKAVDFVTLMVLDELGWRVGPARMLSDDDVDAAVAEVRSRYPRAMTKDLDSDAMVRERAIELLRALDLLRTGPQSGAWWLSPAAARFRNPAVVAVTSRIDEE